MCEMPATCQRITQRTCLCVANIPVRNTSNDKCGDFYKRETQMPLKVSVIYIHLALLQNL